MRDESAKAFGSSLIPHPLFLAGTSVRCAACVGRRNIFQHLGGAAGSSRREERCQRSERMSGEIAQSCLMTDARAPLVDQSEAQTGLALLITRARAGDATAFEELMICTQHKVVATAWRMLGQREDARDAAQEVYLRVFKYLDRYDPAQDFHGWLYRITMNVCRDTARKRRRRDEGSDWFDAPAHVRAIEPLTQTHETDVEAQTLRAQQRALVTEALATLSEKER